jgi:hypothetical protein
MSQNKVGIYLLSQRIEVRELATAEPRLSVTTLPRASLVAFDGFIANIPMLSLTGRMKFRYPGADRH